MRRKVERVSNEIAERLNPIDGIEAITLHESAESDILDPYFFLSLDIYYKGALPSAQDRLHFFEDAGGFESSEYTDKDRFFLEELPVRLEYKHTTRIDHIVEKPVENLKVFRENGTYTFYRLYYGNVITKNGNWLDTVRTRIEKLPEIFWEKLRASFFSTAEHHLTDLKSAVVREDELFYLFSLSGFLKSFCSFLFAVNTRFEPSGRKMYNQILDLPILPQDFKGHFTSLLREDPELPPSRKQEIAEKIVKSALYMV